MDINGHEVVMCNLNKGKLSGRVVIEGYEGEVIIAPFSADPRWTAKERECHLIDKALEQTASERGVIDG